MMTKTPVTPRPCWTKIKFGVWVCYCWQTLPECLQQLSARCWAETGTKPESIRTTWRTTFVFNGQSRPLRHTRSITQTQSGWQLWTPPRRHPSMFLPQTIAPTGEVAPLPAEEDINRKGISVCPLPVVQQPGHAALAVEAVSLLCSKSLYHSIRGACGGGNKEWGQCGGRVPTFYHRAQSQ